MRNRLLLCMTLCLSLFVLCPASTVFGFSSLVTFGDSLSDTGNLGRYTDGDVWVELVSESLGIPLENWAHVGATTGYDNPAAELPITGLLWQVDTFLLSSTPQDDSLFALWAGANDFLQGRDAEQATENMISALGSLYGDGGREFLFLNLPDIGSTPYFVSLGEVLSGIASDWTIHYNDLLESKLDDFFMQYTDAVLYFVDIFTIFDEVQVGTKEWSTLFWGDGFHPSSIGHERIASAALAAATVPEPATLILFAGGLMVLGLCWKGKKNVAS